MPSSAPATPERVLRRLEWRVIRRLDGRLQGDYRTLLRGSGVDFADLRDYEPGDDVRRIDWNVTARTDAVHVRTYLEDRELTAWLLLDRSPSMGFGPTERPKELVLTELATTLARLFTRGGNRVGAILWDNRAERTIEPRTGRNQVLRLTHDLLRPAAPRGSATTELAGLFRLALSTIRRRSLVVIVSDFLTDPGWEKPLTLLAQRHELVVLHLYDPRETELPDAGLLVVEDVETGELLSVDTSDPEFRRRFAEVAAARQADLEAAAARAGVELYPVSTEEDLVTALVRSWPCAGGGGADVVRVAARSWACWCSCPWRWSATAACCAGATGAWPSWRRRASCPPRPPSAGAGCGTCRSRSSSPRWPCSSWRWPAPRPAWACPGARAR